ncbi:hypothetical protein ZWY2020_045833 [Hordeum vulgare]|nr:hypothetical protein ZWY2020_045833 [Hordeum vulgare]
MLQRQGKLHFRLQSGRLPPTSSRAAPTTPRRPSPPLPPPNADRIQGAAYPCAVLVVVGDWGNESRFACLQDDEGPREDDPPVSNGSLPLVARRRKSDEEVAQDFWADIGYPTLASRVWERPSTRCSGEVSIVCRSTAQEDSISREKTASPDVVGLETTVLHAAALRAAVGAPARPQELVKPWVGPIPPPQVSPNRTLGDLLPPACLSAADPLSQPCSPMGS